MLDSMGHELLLFNKPYDVLCQFTGKGPTLADFIDLPGFYPAGRLDKDSEGLLILTNSGRLQARISEPKEKMPKRYWVQTEGICSDSAIKALANGVTLRDGLTRPAKVRRIDQPLPKRNPDIRSRPGQPTGWLEVTLFEGKNRQVRRMTAAVGFPTLRLFRAEIGPFSANGIEPGTFERRQINLPKADHRRQHRSSLEVFRHR